MMWVSRFPSVWPERAVGNTKYSVEEHEERRHQQDDGPHGVARHRDEQRRDSEEHGAHGQDVDRRARPGGGPAARPRRPQPRAARAAGGGPSRRVHGARTAPGDAPAAGAASSSPPSSSFLSGLGPVRSTGQRRVVALPLEGVGEHLPRRVQTAPSPRARRCAPDRSAPSRPCPGAPRGAPGRPNGSRPSTRRTRRRAARSGSRS